MPGQAVVTINENQWSVSVASTTVELTTGLSGVASIPAGTGMLFILPARQLVTVDTSQMLFGIDIIFIKDNAVLSIARNIEPGYLVTEETPIDMFLEVNVGEAELVEVGDIVSTVSIQEPGFDWSQIISFAIPLAILGFVFGISGISGGGSSSKEVRRLGKPRTEEERARVHEEFYGTRELPPRGTGLKEREESTEGRRLGEPKAEAERREAHERKYGTEELPERGKGLEHSITSEEWREAEGMWQVTKEDAERGEPAGVYLWALLNRHYPDKKDKQIRLMGFVAEVSRKYKGRIPRAEAWELARKWDVEKAVATELMEFFPGQSEHHSMWLTLEQRKELEKKSGAVAVRWAEEATRPGDIKGVEAAAEYYYKKLKEVFGLGHLSPELTEEQIRKLREVLGLPKEVPPREKGYID